jgi:sarcosine oxidase subunit alpha
VEEEGALEALWAVPPPRRRPDKRFVDIQDDVTLDDVTLAEREGYRSVEHLKRYTTLGMGTDQGKTSNVNGLALLASVRGEAIPAVGHTTFRPPYTPVTLGAIVGPDRGKHFHAIRRSAMHDWHETHGAAFLDAGLWVRPRYYPRTGESIREAFIRETNTVRAACGLVDVSTLGKIDIQGPDAGIFLDRIYTNTFSALPVGRARYGLMLREDGMVLDDGTTSRLGEAHYFMTTTTANAVAVMQRLDFYLQTVWPELRVHASSVTEQWAAMALAGPHSRAVLMRLAEDFDAANAAMPHMAVREGRIAGVPARVFRLSFSGELAYEINVPADRGTFVWQAVLEAGRSLGITPYGTEAMGAMRIEKGHVAGPELDGRTTAEDLGLGKLVSTKKEFVGRRSLGRPGLQDAGRKRLVGLVPADGHTRLRPGAQLVLDETQPKPVEMLGHVTSVTYSPTLGHPIALGLLAGGLARKGQVLHAAYPLRNDVVEVKVVDPVFFDPEGKRLHA